MQVLTTAPALAQVTRVPFFRDELQRVLQDKIVDEYLWPRRLVVPAEQPGAIGVPVLSPEQVSVQLSVTDCL